MTVTFLGTGTSQGIPVIACMCKVCQSMDFRDIRTRTSVHIQTGNSSLVIDTGPDFRQQVLRERISHLDAVIYTHQHRDHTAGLDEIRSFNFHQKIDMPLFATKDVLNQLKQEFAYIFNGGNYPGLPRVVPHTITNEPFQVAGDTITPIQVMHYKLPVLGFRIGDFCYVTDANYISDEEKAKMVGAKILVLNALQHKSHISHFNLQEALELIEEVKPKQAYLTHISHNLGNHKEVDETLPPNVSLAFDGLQIEL